MSYFCFFSYAHADKEKNEYLKRFIQEISGMIRVRLGEPEGTETVFWDQPEIKPGEDWTEVVRDALQTTRVMLCLYSPSYFKREVCGKELQVFRLRQQEFVKLNPAAKSPPVIVPILWLGERNLPKQLPQAVSKIEYPENEYGPNYKQEGLEFIARVGKHKDEYEELKTNLVNRLLDVGQKFTLPRVNDLPEVEKVQDAFKIALNGGAAAAPATVEEDSEGPSNVQFFYVAGRRKELQTIRNEVKFYGAQGGGDWKPWPEDLTAPESPIALLAQDVATRERLISQPMPLDDLFLQRLQEANQKKNIAVIMLDPWTLHLDDYRNRVRVYNGIKLASCVVLLVRNDQDDETKQSWNKINAALAKAFPDSFDPINPLFSLGEWVISAEDFRNKLPKTLQAVRTRIISTAEILRKATGTGDSSIPMVIGPSGNSPTGSAILGTRP